MIFGLSIGTLLIGFVLGWFLGPRVGSVLKGSR